MSRMDAPVVAAMPMRASRSRSETVEASSTIRMVRASRGRFWGSSWARYQATVSDSIPVAAGEGPGGFAFDCCSDDAVADGGPGGGAGGDGGGLACPGPSYGRLVAVAVPAPGSDEASLFISEMGVLGDRGCDVVVGNEAGPSVQPFGEPGDDPVLDAEHLDGGEQRLLASGHLLHVL